MSKIHESESIQDQKADEIDVILAELTLRSNGLPVGSLPSGAKVLIPSLDMQNAKQQLLSLLNEERAKELELHRGDAIGGGKAGISMTYEEVENRIAQLGGKDE